MLYYNMDYNVIQLSLDSIKEDNPSIRDTTLKTYGRQLNKLYGEFYLKDTDLPLTHNLPNALLDTDKTIAILNDKGWGLSENSIKNYLSVIMSVCRNVAEFDNCYASYLKEFYVVRDSINARQIKQEPKNKAEEDLQHISLEDLEGYLWYHKKRSEGKENKDIESALLYMLGHIHLDQKLRNECAGVVLTKRYITTEEDKYVNFIWVKNRNEKRLVIRRNKVRNPDSDNYKAKEVVLGKACNTAINKYIQILERNDIHIPPLGMPLLHKFKGSQGEMSSANYTQIIKKVWAHRDLALTSTLIRKLYAIEVRNKYKGKLTEEAIACEVLDHSQEIHDKNYVIMFD